MTSAGVLDTSIFIAHESGRRLDASVFPDEVATTVVTVAELNLGVLAAASADVRAQRLATLDAIADIVAFPVDDSQRACGRDCESTWQRPVAESASTIFGSRPSQRAGDCRW